MLCPIVCVEYYYEVITSYAGDPVMGDKSGNFKHTAHSNYEKFSHAFKAELSGKNKLQVLKPNI